MNVKRCRAHPCSARRRAAGSPFPNNYEQDLTRNQMGDRLTIILSPSMVNTFGIAANVYVLDLNIEGIDYDSQVPGFSPQLPFPATCRIDFPWSPSPKAGQVPEYRARVR